MCPSLACYRLPMVQLFTLIFCNVSNETKNFRLHQVVKTPLQFSHTNHPLKDLILYDACVRIQYNNKQYWNRL